MSTRSLSICAACIASLCISLLAYSAPAIGSLEAQIMCAQRGVPSQPITTGMLAEAANEFAHLSLSEGHTLICEVGNDVPFYVESLSVKATANHPAALVIWLRQGITRIIDRASMRFVVVHEIGHQILPVGDGGVCPEGDDIAANIACEHTVDDFAAHIIGLDDALHGLSFGRSLIVAANRGALSIDIMDQRIHLLCVRLSSS